MSLPTLLMMVLAAAVASVAIIALVHLRYRRPLQALLNSLEKTPSESEPSSFRDQDTPLVTRLADKIQQLQESNHRLHQQTIKDPLTGLGNRRLLEQRLEIALPLSRRWMNAVSALMIDVDHFKDYNDLYGHQAGDDCLLEIANVLRPSAAKPISWYVWVARSSLS